MGTFYLGNFMGKAVDGLKRSLRRRHLKIGGKLFQKGKFFKSIFFKNTPFKSIFFKSRPFKQSVAGMMMLVFVMPGMVCNAADNGTKRRGGEQRVGLVLSGGGARGIAEIGVIQALEENNIPIDYITGTSIGAIVGGLYAAGYSPEEMMELVKSKMFIEASTGTLNPRYTYRFFQPDAKPTMLNLNMAPGTLTLSPILPSSLISPMPMNFSFMSIFARYTAHCGSDFDKLFVPLRTVASDMTAKEPKVWSEGQLTDAVRSSMSFPIVFKPVTYKGSLLYDGGIFNNFPVDVMKKDFHPDIMIGVDIHSTDTVKHFPDILQQMDILVIRPQTYDLPADEGIYMRINLNKFSLLDFDKADEIYDIGYRHGLEMVDSIKKRVTARRDASEVAARRQKFKEATPRVYFDSVQVTGGTKPQNEYIKYLFTAEHPDTFGLLSAMESYMMAVSTTRLKDLEPEAVYNKDTDRFKLMLNASFKNPIDIGIGGYVTSSTNSMLFLSLGYNSINHKAISASLSGWIGQSYMAAMLDTKLMLRRRHVSALGFEAVVWRQKFYENDKLFYQTDAPAFIADFETFARLKYSRATGRQGIFSMGVAYGHTDARFYNNDESIVHSDTERNKTIRDMGQVSVRWTHSTLDDNTLPLEGRYLGVLGQGVWERYHFIEGAPIQRAVRPEEKGHDKWLQLELKYKDYFNLSKSWALGLESDIVMSTHHLLKEYNAALVNATAFNPTASSYNFFSPKMRANSFVTVGVVPVYKFNERMTARLGIYGFMPMRPICQDAVGNACYGRWFSRASLYSELSASLKLPFGNLTAYGSYHTTPGNRWSVGISFGYFILAPRMTRL